MCTECNDPQGLAPGQGQDRLPVPPTRQDALGPRRGERVSGRTGFISRVLWSVPAGRSGIIYLGSESLRTSSSPPGTQAGQAAPSPPIWPCSEWGLPSGPCCQRPGALLPHPFTLACSPPDEEGSSAVCSLRHFPSPLGARALPGILPCGARTFLRRRFLRNLDGDPSARSSEPVQDRVETPLQTSFLRNSGRIRSFFCIKTNSRLLETDPSKSYVPKLPNSP